ncbi:MAG: tetratricopeptide repeat protein [Candidatus Krumholzibacteriota bacterium]|nr:tetratricopeptide repeat protein [Candidatus Krumholzibacteriota bacterium]
MTQLQLIGLGVAILLAAILAVWILVRLGGGRRDAGTVVDHHLVALEALADGESGRAREELKLAVQAGQGGADAYLRLADLYRAEGQLKKAIHLHRALEVGQNWSQTVRERILRGLAEDYLAAGRWDDALGQLEQLRKLGGRDPGLLRRLSQVHLRRGDGERAQSMLRRAHRIEGEEKPDELAILLAEHARRLIGEQRHREARKALQEALKQDGDCLPALALSVDLHIREGDEQKAADEIQRLVLTGQPGSELDYPRMEKLFFELGRFHEIQFVYQELLSKVPGFWPARFALADLLDKRGRRDEATHLLEFSREAPDAVAGRAAGRLLAWGETEAAARWLERWRDPLAPATRGYRCRNCGMEHTRPRWYCPSCHGFKSYEPIREESEAAGA